MKCCLEEYERKFNKIIYPEVLVKSAKIQEKWNLDSFNSLSNNDWGFQKLNMNSLWRYLSENWIKRDRKNSKHLLTPLMN